jgi:hypothetical protein
MAEYVLVLAFVVVGAVMTLSLLTAALTANLSSAGTIL